MSEYPNHYILGPFGVAFGAVLKNNREPPTDWDPNLYQHVERATPSDGTDAVAATIIPGGHEELPIRKLRSQRKKQTNSNECWPKLKLICLMCSGKAIKILMVGELWWMNTCITALTIPRFLILTMMAWEQFACGVVTPFLQVTLIGFIVIILIAIVPDVKLWLHMMHAVTS